MFNLWLHSHQQLIQSGLLLILDLVHLCHNGADIIYASA